MYIDFYIKGLNNIWNYIKNKYTFFNNKLSYLKVQDTNITEKEYDTKKKIFEILYDLSLCSKTEDKKKLIDQLFYSRNLEENIITNLFGLIFDKGYNYLKELSHFQKIKIYFSFLNINNLCYFNELSSLTDIDLTGIKTNSIKALCDVVPFINLQMLKICKNNEIDYSDLKNAKFTKLKILYLAEDGIEDLNKIEMDKYPFEDLEILNLSQNNIESVESILHFINLKVLNLRGNKVFNEGAILLIQKLKCSSIDLRGNYAYKEEIKNICGEVPNVIFNN